MIVEDDPVWMKGISDLISKEKDMVVVKKLSQKVKPCSWRIMKLILYLWI